MAALVVKRMATRGSLKATPLHFCECEHGTAKPARNRALILGWPAAWLCDVHAKAWLTSWEGLCGR